MLFSLLSFAVSRKIDIDLNYQAFEVQDGDILNFNAGFSAMHAYVFFSHRIQNNESWLYNGMSEFHFDNESLDYRFISFYVYAANSQIFLNKTEPGTHGFVWVEDTTNGDELKCNDYPIIVTGPKNIKMEFQISEASNQCIFTPVLNNNEITVKFGYGEEKQRPANLTYYNLDFNNGSVYSVNTTYEMTYTTKYPFYVQYAGGGTEHLTYNVAKVNNNQDTFDEEGENYFVYFEDADHIKYMVPPFTFNEIDFNTKDEEETLWSKYLPYWIALIVASFVVIVIIIFVVVRIIKNRKNDDIKLDSNPLV